MDDFLRMGRLLNLLGTHARPLARRVLLESQGAAKPSACAQHQTLIRQEHRFQTLLLEWTLSEGDGTRTRNHRIDSPVL